MFALFFNLYLAMFRGVWFNYSLNDIPQFIKPTINTLGELLTSMFNNVDTPLSTLGEVLTTNVNGVQPYIALIAFVLATITSIGIVVMAVKGIKKVFGIFFYGVK